jgi:hypothetical protein
VSRERQGPQELQASQGSVEMRASAEFERSRSRDLQRQPAIVPRERRPVAAPMTAVPTEIVLKMTSLQDSCDRLRSTWQFRLHAMKSKQPSLIS